MKTYLELVDGLLTAILADIQATYPSTELGTSDIVARLQSIKEKRGLGFYTLTLPQIGKWFDKSLSEAKLLPQTFLLHGKVSAEDVRPSFLKGLYAAIFDNSGTLLSEPDPDAILLLRTVYYFAKKLKVDCKKEKVYEAVRDFIRDEEDLIPIRPSSWGEINPKWIDRTGHPASTSNGYRYCEESSFSTIEWRLFRQVCRAAAAQFGELDAWSIRPKHGPGAVSDSGPRGRTKYELEHWPEKLSAVFPSDYFGTTNFVEPEYRTDREFPSKLISVPKTAKGPRLIAAEPTAHQWIQGGIRRWFEDTLREIPLGLSIDFRSQEYSREMALQASATGAFATVDLKSASDRLSADLVEYVFQSNTTLLDALNACRTTSTFIPDDLLGYQVNDEGGVTLGIKKFATQGSACTFPVQSIVFTILAHFAVMITNDDRDVSWAGFAGRAGQIRVFGDDIIVPSDSYQVLTRLLTELGLKVNTDKSFSEGNFREACGMDAFMGYDVTPAYILRPYETLNPESLGSVLECSNNFYKKGLWHAAAFLQKTLPEAELALIPVSDRAIGSCTLHTFMAGTAPLKRVRWNKHMHYMEAFLLELYAKSRKRQGTGESLLLQYFTEEPSQDLPWSSGQAERPTISKRRRWARIEF